MPDYKTTAITLRTYDFKEFDKIVVLYSQEKGLLRAIAKGIKKNKSKFSGKVSPLVAADFILYEGKNLDIVTQCDPIDFFKNIKTSFKKISFAFYYAELMLAFAMEEDPNSEAVYNFFLDSLKRLENSDETNNLDILLLNYQFELISMAGYAPMLNCCVSCNAELTADEQFWLKKNSGTLYCNNCVTDPDYLMQVDEAFLAILLNFYGKSIKNLLNLNYSAIIKAHEFLFEYISQKTNYKLKTPKLIENFCLS